MNTNKRVNTRYMVVAAILTAVACVLQYIEFPIPIMPGFVKLDFSDLPALLGAFSLGPVYGVVIEFLKNVIHLPFGSSAGVGELCNFLFGAVFTFVAGLIYAKMKSRKGAIIGSVVGALAMAAVSIPMNYFFVYPAYVQLYHMPMEAIVGMYDAILPGTNDLLQALLIFNLPFTFAKGIIDAIFCFVIYKPLSPIIKGNK